MMGDTNKLSIILELHNLYRSDAMPDKDEPKSADPVMDPRHSPPPSSAGQGRGRGRGRGRGSG